MSASRDAVRHREHVFEAFAQSAQELYGEQLHDIILYGSVARGDATEQSDVDVLVVLSEKPPEELTKRPNPLTDLAFDVGLEHDVKISIYFRTRELFESQQNHPFLRNVIREGRTFDEMVANG